MVIRGTGLFKGFDLEDADSLHDLGLWLLEWREGNYTREPNYNPIAPTSKNQIRRATAERLTRLLNQSPLIKEILEHFLAIHRDSLGQDSLLAAGKILSDYGIAFAVDPKITESYNLAKKAWETRIPVGPPKSVLPDYEARLAKTMKAIKDEEAMRAKELKSPKEYSPEQVEINAYNQKALREVRKIEARARAAEARRKEKEERAIRKKRNSEEDAIENTRSPKRVRVFDGPKREILPRKAKTESSSSSSPAQPTPTVQPLKTVQPVQHGRIYCRDDTAFVSSLTPPRQMSQLSSSSLEVDSTEPKSSPQKVQSSSPTPMPKSTRPGTQSTGQKTQVTSSSSKPSSSKNQPARQKRQISSSSSEAIPTKAQPTLQNTQASSSSPELDNRMSQTARQESRISSSSSEPIRTKPKLQPRRSRKPKKQAKKKNEDDRMFPGLC